MAQYEGSPHMLCPAFFLKLHENAGGFLEELISQYGYIAIFILTFFEGESVLIAAGFLAFSGYLNAIAIVLVSTAASYVGHGTFFLIALHKRESFLAFVQRFIKVNLSKLEILMAKYGTVSIFISQWLYGFRLLSAAVLGLSRMGKTKYFTFQLISCLIWAIICTASGYFFGATLKNFLGDVKKYEPYIAAGVLIVGFILWYIRDVRKRSHDSGQDMNMGP
jgi:membrane protein DedA with SNARE-associated domain